MKVRISLAVEIDPEAWALEFGVDPSEVREDVKVYMAGLIDAQIERLGLEGRRS